MPTDDKGIRNNWRDLAERASGETDPERLVKVIQELCEALDQQRMQQRAKLMPKRTGTSADD